MVGRFYGPLPSLLHTGNAQLISCQLHSYWGGSQSMMMMVAKTELWTELIFLFSVVHLDVEGTSEELLRQLSYAIKNQRGASKIPP